MRISEDLQVASRVGSAAAARLLLERGAKMDPPKGSSPLEISIREGQLAAASVLYGMGR